MIILPPGKVRFALSSSPVFSRTDTVTDSERFYNTVLELFELTEEREEIDSLLTWWNRCVIWLMIIVMNHQILQF